jgi:NADPH:quinone reductase-like Zn-dependent oxidoreductase
MKAFVLESFETPARLSDVDDPNITEDALLVGIRSASVNAFDVATANGALQGIIEHEFPVIVGRDFAGVVEAIGSAKSGFAVGDQVFGYVPAFPLLRAGSFAERIAVDSGSAIVRRPEGWTCTRPRPFRWPARPHSKPWRRSIPTSMQATVSSSSARPAASADSRSSSWLTRAPR